MGVELVDALAAEGRREVSADEVRVRLGLSAQAASNVLTRLARDGLVEKVRRGVYLLRPLGELGVTSLASDRLAEVVDLAVGDRDYRICFRTALTEHGLLTRPGQRVQVAVTRRLFVKTLGDRPLESIIEKPSTIHLGTQRQSKSMVSTIERALLESAQTPRRVGGIAVVAEALAASSPNPAGIVELSGVLHFDAALRRLVSLDRLLKLGKLDSVELEPRPTRMLMLDPTDDRSDGPIDTETSVRWPFPVDELLQVVHR